MQRTFNDETFRIAADMVLRETKYFPTIKDIFDLRNAVYQVKNNMVARAGERKALPEETGNLTDEEIVQNLAKIKIITDVLCGKITKEEGEAMQNELVAWAQK